MVTTIIDWDGKQNVVVITDGTQTIRVPLDHSAPFRMQASM
jgi:hypothetical protein